MVTHETFDTFVSLSLSLSISLSLPLYLSLSLSLSDYGCISKSPQELQIQFCKGNPLDNCNQRESFKLHNVI